MLHLNKKADNDRLPAEIVMGMHISGERYTAPFYYILRSLLAAAGIFGSLMCFLTACAGKADIHKPSGAVILAAFLGWAFFSAAFSLHEKRPALSSNAASVGVIMLLLYGIIRIDRISAGLMYETNTFLGGIYDIYKNSPLFAVPDVGGDIAACADEAVILIVLFICAAVCRGTVRGPNILLVVGGTFPLWELCLFNGLVPDTGAFALVLLSWCGALAAEIAQIGVSEEKGGQLFVKTSVESAWSAAVMLLIAFGAASAGAAAIPRPQSMDSFRETFIKYMSDFSWKKFFEDFSDAFLPTRSRTVTHDGKLGNVDRVEFSGADMLEVTLPADSGNIYLKGFSATEYTGSRWNEGTPLPELETRLTSPEFFSGRTLKFVPGCEELSAKRVIVRNTGAPSYSRYFPENSAGLLAAEGTVRTYGVYFPDEGWRSRALSSRDMPLLPDVMSSDEKKLRTYAYTYCLDVPESFSAGETFFEDYEGNSIIDEIAFIRNKLAAECEYTLDSGKKPFGADFAQWFLEENKKGSCTHFATAAALLCRTRGIPSRYCEGFVIKQEDISDYESHDGYVTVTVPDSRAHAWIEIYADGLGWMPFEVTPGYGNILVEYTDGVQNEGETITSVLTTVTTQEPMYSETLFPQTEMSVTSAGTSVSEDEEQEETADTTSVTGAEEITETATFTETETSSETSETSVNSSESMTPGSSDNQNSGEDPNSGGSGSPFGDGNGGGNSAGGENITSPAGMPDESGGGDGGTDELRVEEPTTTAPEETTLPTESSTDPDDEKYENKPDPEIIRAVLRVLMYICIAAAAVGAVYLRRRIVLAMRAKRVEEMPVKAASQIYGMLIRLARERKLSITEELDRQAEELAGTGLFDKGLCDNIIGTALVARFGGGISAEEAQSAADAYEQLVNGLADSTRLQKIVRKYIFITDRYN